MRVKYRTLFVCSQFVDEFDFQICYDIRRGKETTMIKRFRGCVPARTMCKILHIVSFIIKTSAKDTNQPDRNGGI